MDDWNVFLVFDREVDKFSSYDGELVDSESKSAFKVKSKAGSWNEKSKGMC